MVVKVSIFNLLKLAFLLIVGPLCISSHLHAWGFSEFISLMIEIGFVSFVLFWLLPLKEAIEFKDMK